MADFDRAIAFVLAREGAYVNNPADPGGETNFGICKRDYPALDIKNLTVAQATAIYKSDYWTPAGCEAMPWPLSLIVFDTAVNMGRGAAEELLHTAHNAQAYLWARLDRYRAIVLKKPALAPFLPGWIRRMVLLYEATQ